MSPTPDVAPCAGCPSCGHPAAPLAPCRTSAAAPESHLRPRHLAAPAPAASLQLACPPTLGTCVAPRLVAAQASGTAVSPTGKVGRQPSAGGQRSLSCTQRRQLPGASWGSSSLQTCQSPCCHCPRPPPPLRRSGDRRDHPWGQLSPPHPRVGCPGTCCSIDSAAVASLACLLDCTHPSDVCFAAWAAVPVRAPAQL